MPVFTSLLIDAPVGKGPCQEFALMNLVREMTLAITGKKA